MVITLLFEFKQTNKEPISLSLPFSLTARGREVLQGFGSPGTRKPGGVAAPFPCPGLFTNEYLQYIGEFKKCKRDFVNGWGIERRRIPESLRGVHSLRSV
jgi:hypothetical protein